MLDSILKIGSAVFSTLEKVMELRKDSMASQDGENKVLKEVYKGEADARKKQQEAALNSPRTISSILKWLRKSK